MRYATPKSNEWVRPIRRGYKLACCDCGLTHDVDFRVVRGRVEFRVRRNNRSTALVRRGKKLWKWRDGTWRGRRERAAFQQMLDREVRAGEI